MKRLTVGFIVGVVVSVAIMAGSQSLLEAIDRSKCKAYARDLRSMATAVEQFKDDHGTYPVASSIEGVKHELEPDYWRKVPPGMTYESDGQGYKTTSSWPSEGVADRRCYFEVRDGVLVHWPDYLGPDFGGALASRSNERMTGCACTLPACLAANPQRCADS